MLTLLKKTLRAVAWRKSLIMWQKRILFGVTILLNRRKEHWTQLIHSSRLTVCLVVLTNTLTVYVGRNKFLHLVFSEGKLWWDHTNLSSIIFFFCECQLDKCFACSFNILSELNMLVPWSFVLSWPILGHVVKCSAQQYCPLMSYICCITRVWLTWTNLLKWYLAIWQQVDENKIIESFQLQQPYVMYIYTNQTVPFGAATCVYSGLFMRLATELLASGMPCLQWISPALPVISVGQGPGVSLSFL